MSSLDAYSLAVLQTAQQLLAEIDPAGAATTADLRARLGAEIEQRRAATATRLAQVDITVKGPSGPACPSCGRGHLSLVANRDGLRILGCRLCRYSRIEEAR